MDFLKQVITSRLQQVEETSPNSKEIGNLSVLKVEKWAESAVDRLLSYADNLLISGVSNKSLNLAT
jgi:hypothetical protein